MSAKLQVSMELDKFCIAFIEEAPPNADLPKGWANAGLSHLNSGQHAVFAKYLAELLDGRHSNDELVRLWDRTIANYMFGNGKQLRLILQTTLDMIRARSGQG